MNIDELEKKIKLEDKFRDFTWINKQYQKGRLKIWGYTVTEERFNWLREAIRGTNEIYEGLWDLEASITRDGSTIKVNILGIIIHFPEITITNGRSGSNNTHVIQDLFVNIPLGVNDRGLTIGEITGDRTTVTKAEHSSNYAHSHLRSRNYNNISLPNFSTFCTGSGHINIIRSNINGDGFTKEVFVNFLVQIMGLVTWESIEGTPYTYISEIRERNSSGNTYSPNRSKALQILSSSIEEHKAGGITPDIDITLTGDNYKVRDNDKLYEFIKSAPIIARDEVRFLALYDGSNYYKVNSPPGISSITARNTSSNFIFQGRLIPFVVSDEEEENTTNYEKVVHPNMVVAIKEKIENDINIKKIRKSTIDRYQS